MGQIKPFSAGIFLAKAEQYKNNGHNSHL